MRGQLNEASAACRDAMVSNAMSGWTAWTDYFPSLYLADIDRVRAASPTALRSAATSIEPVIAQEGDVSAAGVARLIDWSLRCCLESASDSAEELKREHSELVANSDLYSSDRIRIDLSYAEMLIHLRQDEDALQLLEEVLEVVREDKLPISRLKALLLLESLKVRKGLPARWEPLYRACENRSFEIGCGWAVCLALASEGVDQKLVQEWTLWAERHGVRHMSALLANASADTQASYQSFCMSFTVGWC